MTGPDPAVAATRVAVRRALAAGDPGSAPVQVACSGGADSLALLAAAVFAAGVEASARAVLEAATLAGGDTDAARAAWAEARAAVDVARLQVRGMERARDHERGDLEAAIRLAKAASEAEADA